MKAYALIKILNKNQPNHDTKESKFIKWNKKPYWWSDGGCGPQIFINMFIFLSTSSFDGTKDNNSDKEGTKRAKEAQGFNPPNCSICFSMAETIISK